MLEINKIYQGDWIELLNPKYVEITNRRLSNIKQPLNSFIGVKS